MQTYNDNIFQQVITYTESGLGVLQNQNCFIGTFNTKYKTFNDMPANLGNTVNISVPVRAISSNGLVAQWSPVEQMVQPLTCDQASNSSQAFTAQQFIFNAEEYLDEFGKARIAVLGAEVEANVAKNANSSVPVMTVDQNGQTIPTGALHTESGPFLFSGDGVTPINNFQQIASIINRQRDYGTPGVEDAKIYLDLMSVPQIIGSGLNQFVPARNERLANSWDLGSYNGSSARYYQSNFLPIQTAGAVGNDGVELTLVSTNDPSGNAITELTVSGGGSTTDALKAGDLGQFLVNFNDGTPLVYLHYTGYKPSQNRVQIRVLEDADSVADSMTIKIYPALRWQPGLNQNLSAPLVAGMKLKFLPTHRCGLLTVGDAAYLAMPPLPSTSPYASHTATDSETKVSLRNYFGFMMPMNSTGYVNDVIWASTIVPWYSRRIIFPINQNTLGEF